VALVLLPSHKFVHYHLVTTDCRKSKNEPGMAFNVIMFIPSFVKIGELDQKLYRGHTFLTAC